MIYKEFVDSSNIDYLEYNTDTLELFVQFKGGGLYKYSGVPEQVYKDIVNAKLTDKEGNKSVGGTFYKLIKTKSYPYTRLN